MLQKAKVKSITMTSNLDILYGYTSYNKYIPAWLNLDQLQIYQGVYTYRYLKREEKKVP